MKAKEAYAANNKPLSVTWLLQKIMIEKSETGNVFASGKEEQEEEQTS